MSKSKRDAPMQEAPTEWRRILMEEGPDGEVRPVGVSSALNPAPAAPALNQDVPEEWADILQSQDPMTPMTPMGSANVGADSISLQEEDFSERTIPGMRIPQLYPSEEENSSFANELTQQQSNPVPPPAPAQPIPSPDFSTSALESFPFSNKPSLPPPALLPNSKLPPPSMETFQPNPPAPEGSAYASAELQESTNHGPLPDSVLERLGEFDPEQTTSLDSNSVSVDFDAPLHSEEHEDLQTEPVLEFATRTDDNISYEDLKGHELDLLSNANESDDGLLSEELAETPAPPSQLPPAFTLPPSIPTQRPPEIPSTDNLATEPLHENAYHESSPHELDSNASEIIDGIDVDEPMDAFVEEVEESEVLDYDEEVHYEDAVHYEVSPALPQEWMDQVVSLQEQTLARLDEQEPPPPSNQEALQQAIEQLSLQQNEQQQQIQEQLTQLTAGLAQQEEERKLHYTHDLIQDFLTYYDYIDLRYRSLWETHGENHPAVQELQGVHERLIEMLQRQEIRMIETTSFEFDPQYHRVLQEVPARTPEEDSQISRIFRQGFFYKDKVFRATEVEIKRYSGNS